MGDSENAKAARSVSTLPQTRGDNIEVSFNKVQALIVVAIA
jgi:hypothetical protein